MTTDGEMERLFSGIIDTRSEHSLDESGAIRTGNVWADWGTGKVRVGG